ncbi:MAG: histidine phosphatase family protein [Anaerolineae bacterium]|nr:histidine phosphatase family protein [Anaerolineae bacterium]
MAVKRVIFIRPGETDWNRQLRWQGWVAIPLNELGRKQAQRLASFMRNIGISALYSSDLRRALETAQLIVEPLDFQPILDERLRERNIGDWQGLTPDEMQNWFPDEYARLMEDPDNFRVPGGESRADVRKRMRAAFDDIIAQAAGETVAIMSHTTAINALLTDLLPGGYRTKTLFSNSSVTTIHLGDDGVWQLVAADDVMHLEGLESKAFPELEDKRK